MSVGKVNNVVVSSLTKLAPHVSMSRVLMGCGFVFATTYLLFQKKLLPYPLMKLASKLLFFPTFPLTALMRLGNYWTPVDETLILGCAPMGFMQHPEELYKLGVRGIVNLCYEYEGPTHSYSKLGIKQLYLPNVDHYEVPVEDLKDAVTFIKEHQKRGEKVYVHCKAGHGRAASVALSWLISENRGLSSKDLNASLRQKRKVRGKLFEQGNIKNFVKMVDSSLSPGKNE